METHVPNRFKILEKIGEGVHGTVYKAHDTSTNKTVAIKKVALRTKFGGISPNTVREIKVLQNCDCENILSLITLFPDIVGLSLVFDYIPHTLYSKIRDEENPLRRCDIKNYARMILNGLGYLHSLSIMHRDVKPANMLITEMGILKIADFGLSRLFNKEDVDKVYSPQVASRWYRAPEILWGTQNYSEKIDIWAAGCVFAEMLRGVPLFNGGTDIEQLALVVRTLGTPNTKNWPELKYLPDYNKIRFPHAKCEKWENIFPSFTTKDEIGLVSELVKYNPKHRLSACEALGHSYFDRTME